jgi:hypothetical protein
VGDYNDANRLRVWADRILTHYRDETTKGDLVEHIAARAELNKPASAQGTFIPAGNPLQFGFFAAISAEATTFCAMSL